MCCSLHNIIFLKIKHKSHQTRTLQRLVWYSLVSIESRQIYLQWQLSTYNKHTAVLDLQWQLGLEFQILQSVTTSFIDGNPYRPSCHLSNHYQGNFLPPSRNQVSGGAGKKLQDPTLGLPTGWQANKWVLSGGRGHKRLHESGRQCVRMRRRHSKAPAKRMSFCHWGLAERADHKENWTPLSG